MTQTERGRDNHRKGQGGGDGGRRRGTVSNITKFVYLQQIPPLIIK